MTNEELVRMIQDGQTEYIPQLWDQVYKYIYLRAKRRLIGEEEHIKQLEDDLINESYFDFLLAIEGYKPDGGASFLTYMTYGLKNSFNRALGARTKKGQRDLSRSALRLDAPINDTNDLTLQDMIIDHLAEEDYRYIENDEFWHDVHELLEEAIFIKTSGKIRDALLVMLDKNCNIAEACRLMGIPEEKRQTMYSMHTTALRHIKIYLRGRARQRCREIGLDEYLSMGLHGSGMGAYRRNGYTSSTELAAIRMADQELWYQKIAEMMG